jgi:azobenzene reductase
MKIGIIVSSLRNLSESRRVGDYFNHLILSKNFEVFLLDLEKSKLPLWSEEITDKWENISNELYSCDGFIVVVPEYSGMASPSYKNFLLYCDKKQLAHKPCLIVAISSGKGGAYVISELRSSGYKNTLINYIPEHIIIRDVTQITFDKNSQIKEDIYIQNRIDYALNILLEYTNLLIPIRTTENLNYKKYPNGM